MPTTALNTATAEPLLRLEGIHKAFGPVQALAGVDLTAESGTIHGLIGENGAGKSTLMKILSGVHRPDQGKMFFDGAPYAPQSPLDARRSGVSMIYQELVLAPHLTVEENVTLGAEHASFGWIRPRTDEVRAVLSWLDQDIDPGTPVRKLSIGKQQLVEIARALLMRSRVVVMDEPTSSLSASDVRALFSVIRRLKERGVAVIYISHFLEEVQEICDTYTVVRDGQTISSGRVADTSIGQIIRDMVGRSVDELFPESTHTIGAPILHVSALSGRDGYPERVSFDLRRGEILGIAGLVGSGRSETVRSIFGLNRAADGRLTVDGRPDVRAAYVDPPGALRYGFDLLSENRKEEGLALNLSVLENLTLSDLASYARGGFLNLRREREVGKEWIDALGVRCRDASQKVTELSGGNQQKACIARLLHQDNDILFLDEPTRGIDIGSKAEIYRLIHELAGRGKAIVMISSYLPELRGVCDTLAVMYKGVMSPVRPVDAWSETSIMRFATAGVHDPAS